MKHSISMINPNFRMGPKVFNSYYLPYTTGVLWAYVKQFEHIEENFEVNLHLWKREITDEVIEQIKDDDIVCFSTYIWNRNYNYEVARKLKEINPNVITIFGGPEMPITRADIFEKLPFVDMCVKMEGEKTFKAVLEEYMGNKDFKSIQGLIINDNGVPLDTGDIDRISDLDTIPSPYLTGEFDDMIAAHPEINWSVVMESTRGCPYQCTFCDWGSLTYSKIKKFDLERVLGEVRWLGENQIDYVTFADANFGAFFDRDFRIAEELVDVMVGQGNPKHYTFTFAKNQRAEIIQITKKLIEATKAYGLNVSVQSLSERTLEVIKRKNMQINKIGDIFDICQKESIPMFTELIQGLPGETLTSWEENFYKLYYAGNHNGIAIHNCELLENAEMNLTQRAEFNIESIELPNTNEHEYEEEQIDETYDMIVSTIDLPIDTMVEAQMVSWFHTTFHVTNYTSYISRYLWMKHGVAYEDFYGKFLDYIQTIPWWVEQIEAVRSATKRFLTTSHAEYPDIGTIEVDGRWLRNCTLVEIVMNGKNDEVLAQIEKFTRDNYSDIIDPSVMEELLRFQNMSVIRYENIDSYPIELNFEYDFLGYFKNIAPLDATASYTFSLATSFVDPDIELFASRFLTVRQRVVGSAYIEYKK